ncbi:MAG: carboxypeptidase regulatory-like domain-containing protein [Chloroflexi bacterium]|nr:carboxypeptidase regulatory-like domain-containing protein [Chloroflexota bacterium]
MKRMSLFALGLALGLALLLAPSIALAQEPGTATVRGQLVNGTKDGPIPGNIAITLTDESGQNELAQTTTDAEGRFQFPGFVPQPGVSYGIKLNYQGADYETNWPPEDPAQELPIMVYEATDDPSTISLESWHILVQPGEGVLDIDEFMVFTNSSDRAYVGSQVVDTQGRKATLVFSLPQGAYGFQYMQGLMECCVVPTGSGLVDTMAVLPGTKEVFFHYFVDYSGGSYDLARPVDYPVTDVRLLSQEAGQEVSSTLLGNPQTVSDAEGTRYFSLATSNLSPGTVITASFTGLPKKGLQSNLRWLGLGVLVLALGGVAVAYPRLRRQSRSVPQPVPQTAARERLLFEVADLDNHYERGEIPQAEYQARRQPLMELLVHLSSQQEEDEGADS